MHPLQLFSFCPRCGGPFVVHDARSKRCTGCGFTYYHNSSAAVAAFIVNGHDEVLVARRALPPAAGTLDLPGGFVDPGEALETALLREVKEETGLLVTRAEYLFSLPNIYTYSDFEVHTTDAFFLCRVAAMPTTPADDVAALQWMPRLGLRSADFGLHSVRRAVDYFIRRE